MAALKCQECGAPARSDEDRFCGYCGARLPEPEPEPEPEVAAASGRDASRDARFGRLAAHPDTARALAQEVSTAALATRQGAGMLPLLLAGGAALFGVGVAFKVGSGLSGMGVGFGSFALAPVFVLVPILAAGVVLLRLLATGARTASLAAATPEATLALVRDVQTETVGRGEHLRATRRVILEGEDGGRINLEVTDGLARGLAPDDMGVAHVAGGAPGRLRAGRRLTRRLSGGPGTAPAAPRARPPR